LSALAYGLTVQQPIRGATAAATAVSPQSTED
jgi:hypothetical protein